MGAFLPLFSRTRGALVSFMVSVPLQLCNFSNTFPLKTFQAKTRGCNSQREWQPQAGRGAGGDCCAEPCLVAFFLNVHSTIQGRMEASHLGKPQISYTQPNGWKPETSGESLKMWHPTSQWGWSEEKPCGCLPGGKRSLLGSEMGEPVP